MKKCYKTLEYGCNAWYIIRTNVRIRSDCMGGKAKIEKTFLKVHCPCCGNGRLFDIGLEAKKSCWNSIGKLWWESTETFDCLLQEYLTKWIVDVFSTLKNKEANKKNKLYIERVSSQKQ